MRRRRITFADSVDNIRVPLLFHRSSQVYPRQFLMNLRARDTIDTDALEISFEQTG